MARATRLYILQSKALGADRKATDGARVLRLPGTINSKSDTDCKVLI